MTLQRFQGLSRQVQQETVKHFGAFIGERNTVHMNVFLYQLADFYTEVCCVRQTGKIIFLRSFTDTEMLEPYLQSISLDELLKES